MSKLERMKIEAKELQAEIRSEYPHPIQPWPKELEEKQGKLWQLGYRIVHYEEG